MDFQGRGDQDQVSQSLHVGSEVSGATLQLLPAG